VCVCPSSDPVCSDTERIMRLADSRKQAADADSIQQTVDRNATLEYRSVSSRECSAQ
jgi:hypothetical protein